MTFEKIRWPKYEEKSKLGVGGICRGGAVSPNVKFVVQPLFQDYHTTTLPPPPPLKTRWRRPWQLPSFQFIHDLPCIAKL